MRWEDQSFGNLLTAYGIQGQSLPFAKVRRRSLFKMDVVFCDHASPGPLDDAGRNGGRSMYWAHPRCPHHVFYCPEGRNTPPPQGWTETKITVSHRHVGGSTDAVWSLVHWSPPGCTVLPPVTVPAQPWVPLLARINRRNPSRPCPRVDINANPAPRVRPHPTIPNVVLPTGLFPHNLFSR